MILHPVNDFVTFSLPMVVSFGKSRCYSMKQPPLRIISSDCWFADVKAKGPNWMMVNSGRSNPSSYVTIAYYQTQHECSNRMNPYQLSRISTWANLFLILFSYIHSSIPMGSAGTGLPTSNSQTQSFPKKGGCQSHTHHTRRKTQTQSSVLAMRHSLANGIGWMHHTSTVSSQP